MKCNKGAGCAQQYRSEAYDARDRAKCGAIGTLNDSLNRRSPRVTHPGLDLPQEFTLRRFSSEHDAGNCGRDDENRSKRKNGVKSQRCT
jgi:hypothetical protein